MGEDSKIEWCDHTFNGADWSQPLKWNRQAERAGVRRKVFANSLSDFFDNQVDSDWREAAWRVIAECQSLDWLILTKRPQNIRKALPTGVGLPPWPWPHVWLGATVENQAEADRRIPPLLGIPAARHFLSCEPLLESINITVLDIGGHGEVFPLEGTTECEDGDGNRMPDLPCIDWVIAGGESGTNARPAHPDWFRSLRDQCAATGVPFFFKQWGEWIDADQLLETIGSATISADYGVMSWQPRRPLNFTDAAALAKHLDRRCLHNSDGSTMIRVGKKASGALLDGREWREMPDD